MEGLKSGWGVGLTPMVLKGLRHRFTKKLTSQKADKYWLFYSTSNATVAHSSRVHPGVSYSITNHRGMQSKNIKEILRNNIAIAQ